MREPNAEPGELFDVRRGAAYLGVTECALRHQLERGRIPALRLGGRVYLRRRTLDRHLEQLERQWAKRHRS